jgi:uncharacterized protein YxjI
MDLYNAPEASRRQTLPEGEGISLGDGCWINDDAGPPPCKVNGKAARIRDTWVVDDARDEVATIRARKLRIRDARRR